MTDRPGEGYLQRQNDWLRSFLGARGGEPVHELAPEFVAAIILENDRPETMVLQHTFPWSTGLVNVAAAATFNSTLQVENPTGSGLIVVVTGAKLIAKATIGFMQITLDPSQQGAPAPNISLDSRARVVASQPVVASLNRIGNGTNTNGVVVERATSTVAAADIPSVLLPARPVILTPGHRCGIWNGTVNEQLFAMMWGYERPIESTELVNR